MKEEMGVTSLHVSVGGGDLESGGGPSASPAPPAMSPNPVAGTTAAMATAVVPVAMAQPPTAPVAAYYVTSAGPTGLRPGTSALGYTTWSLPQAPPPGVVLVGGNGAPSSYGTAGYPTLR